MTVAIKRLDSGYYHIRGQGPCNWAQPPYWPCPEHVLREYAFPQAGDGFLREVAALAKRPEREKR